MEGGAGWWGTPRLPHRRLRHGAGTRCAAANAHACSTQHHISVPSWDTHLRLEPLQQQPLLVLLLLVRAQLVACGSSRGPTCIRCRP